MLTSINHIGIAVKDLEASKARYSSLFGVEKFHEETVETQKVQIASILIEWHSD